MPNILGLHMGSIDDGHPDGHEYGQNMAYLFTERVGGSGRDYRAYNKHDVYVRLNHSYGSGSIPYPSEYVLFAQRVAAFIATSQGDIKGWIIGNETNHPGEVPPNSIIRASDYVTCFRECAKLTDAPLWVAGPAPWAAVSFPLDWVDYLDVMLMGLAGIYAGVAIHTYTHGQNIGLIGTDRKMDWPYDNRMAEFRAFEDFMGVIPEGVKVIISETNSGASQNHKHWDNSNDGWIVEAVSAIGAWNQQHPQQVIRALVCFRYPEIDSWSMVDKPALLEDLRAAYDLNVTWEDTMAPTWKQLHRNACETGFYDWVEDGIVQPELTFPVNTVVHYIHGEYEGSYNRVEVDAKDIQKGHPEVFEGRFSVSLNWRSSTGRAGIVSDPIYIIPGQPVRGFCQYQHILDGGAGGARMGIVVGGPSDPFKSPNINWPISGPDPFEDDCIKWGNWASSRKQGEIPGLANRTWVTLRTGEVNPPGAYVRFVCQFNADDAGNSMAGVFDVMTVEQYGECQPPPPPPTGTCAGMTPAQFAAGLDAMSAKLKTF